MGQIFHKQRQNLCLLKETTPGTWMTGTSVFVAANAKLPVRNLKFKVANKEIERYLDRNSLDSIESLFYGEEGTIEFDTDLYTSGTAGTIIGTVDSGYDLLQKTLCSSTVNAGTSVVYALNASSQVRISAGVEFISEDGTASARCGIKGAMVVSKKLDVQVGGQAIIHWVLKGPIAYESAVPQVMIAATPIASIVRDSTVGKIPQFKGIAFSVGGVNRQISKLTLDWGISTNYETDSADPTTMARVVFAGRKPTLTIDPQTVPKATQDDFGAFFAGTGLAVSIVLGTVAGKIVTISLPNLQRNKADFGERDVITTTETTFRCNGNSDAGEDSILETYT